MKTNKILMPIFIDFLFLVGFLIAAYVIFLFGKYVLYSDFDNGGELYILTESMNDSYETELSKGDALFDTLTKRNIGFINSVKTINDGDKIKFLISLSASYTPKGKALRTAKVWFYYEILSKKDFENMAYQ